MKNLLIFIMLAPLLLLVPAAHAAPVEANGSFAPASAPVVTDTRMAGGNTIITQEASIAISGTFSGTCVGTERDFLRADGTFAFQGQCTFAGTVAGRSGTAVFIDRGVGTRNGFHGHFATISSSGGLEGLHAWGSFQVTGPGTGTYSGHYFFVGS